MARPRGSKNKTENPVEDVQEFQYNESEQLYHQLMTGELIPVNTETTEEIVQTMNFAPTTMTQVLQTVSVQTTASALFLVEGKVRLDRVGEAPIVADQRRIVNAHNVDDALEKFVNYFINMSNGDQSFSIVQAAASETIL